MTLNQDISFWMEQKPSQGLDRKRIQLIFTALTVMMMHVVNTYGGHIAL